MMIHATVVSGLGEGAYFMSLPHYVREVEAKIGFSPFPGTLNLKVSDSFDMPLHKIRIDGYTDGDKVFGGASCVKASIQTVQGAIIIPDKTKHDNKTIEFIAPVKVREQLQLSDRQEIEIEVE